MAADAPPSCLLVGTGEYTTGFTASGGTKSDKKAGVVFLVHADLRARGLVGERIVLCGTNGAKLPAVRAHLQRAVGGAYSNLSAACETMPADGVTDPEAYLAAIASMRPGDLVSVFTPDDTHYRIVEAAIRRGLHVMVTKPAVKRLAEHRALAALARERGVLLCVEVHKRYDPVYADARNRARELGDFSFFSSYMSQPKAQLETFRAWAGRGSDISYYLNSHHVDFHCWTLRGMARPERVTAAASAGVAMATIGADAEDTVTLQVRWRNLRSGNPGAAVYTASWAAPRGDVHSQQRFHYLAHGGELQVDQAHRGFTAATDRDGHGSLNPLYMRYTPDERGRFAGQHGYGYLSFERFAEAAREIRAGRAAPADFDGRLPTVATTATVTAVLEAGRLSLDSGGAPVEIVYGDDGEPAEVRVVKCD